MELLGPEGELDEKECQVFLESDLEGLDITNEEMDFEELDSLIEIFNKDERVRYHFVSPFTSPAYSKLPHNRPKLKQVQEALTKGVDLRAYTLKIEEDLHSVETRSVQDYVAESENFATLHAQIETCDQILESMEKVNLSGNPLNRPNHVALHCHSYLGAFNLIWVISQTR